MKSQLSCILVDDCELDRRAVESEILNHANLQLIGSFDNCLEAKSFFTINTPDILFVDIDMPEINGLDFIKSINNTDTLSVIISSHPEYALEGFQLKVFDFILKPVETERFDSCINRIHNFIQLKSKAEAYDVLFDNEKIIFKEGYTVINLNANEVIYLEAYGDYTKIVTEKKCYLTLATLSNFLESLPSGKFIRIHRSFVIALNKVQEFGQKSIDMGISLLPVGKTYFKSVKYALR